MPRPKQTERNKRILEMYNSGMSQAEIAEIFGFVPTTISNILRSMPGYERRGSRKDNKQEVSGKMSQEDREAREDVAYMELLEDFSRIVNRVNQCAQNGMTITKLKEKMQKTVPMFLQLVGDSLTNI